MKHSTRDFSFENPISKRIQELTSNDIYIKLILLCSAVICLVTAVYSVGFFYPDEHFQIIEFLMSKIDLGRQPFLAWEYAAQMRPWLEMVLFAPVTYFYKSVGITNGFSLSLAYRILTTLFYFASVVSIVRLANYWFKDITAKRLAIFIVLLSYFIPYLHVRTSSENYSGIMLTLALVTYVIGPKNFKNFVWTGFLLGVSYQFRYQIIFACVGFLFHSLFVGQRKQWNLVGAAILGFGLAYLLGIAANYWGYGHIVLADYKYFEQNILQGKASTFGQSPWYEYFPMLLDAVPIYSWLILASLAYFIVFKPTHILTFIVVPFMAGHMVVAHKEFRFMFSLVDIGLFMTAFLVNDLRLMLTARFSRIGKLKFLIWGMIVCDLIFALIGMFLPAQPSVALLKHIVNGPQPAVILHQDYKIDSAIGILPMPFYIEEKNLTQIRWGNFEELQTLLKTKKFEQKVWILAKLQACKRFDISEDIPNLKSVEVAPFFEAYHLEPWIRQLICRVSRHGEVFQLLELNH